MKTRKRLPNPALSISSRAIRPHGVLAVAINQAAIQQNSAFIDWCRHARKRLTSMAKQKLAYVVAYQARRFQLVLPG